MSLWGRNDNVGSGGLVSLSGNIVTGTATTFGQVGAAKTGDVIRFGVRGNGGTYYGDAVIVGIASTTQLRIKSTAGLSTVSFASTSFRVSELPKYTVLDSTYSNANDLLSSIKNLGITGAATTNAGIGTNIIPVIPPKSLIVGDLMANNGNDIAITVINTNKITLTSAITVGIKTGDTLVFKRYTNGYDKQVYGISTSAYSDVSTAYRTSGEGWVGVTTYIDTHGNLRVKSEILVAMSGITTGSNSISYPTNA